MPTAERLPSVPFDVSQLEREIAEIADYAPRSVQPPPVPLIIQADDVGKLTSEAIMQSYDVGAKSLEALAGELRDLLRRNDEMVTEANEALKQIEETIAQTREQGKLFALKVSAAADMVKAIRSTCDDLRKKINETG